MIDILDYIRSWFYKPTEQTRAKRRAPFEDYDHTISPKIRKMSHRIEDDWIDTSIVNRSRNYKIRPKITSTVPVINIDDDDDVIEVKKPKDTSPIGNIKFTSTPTENRFKFTNGTEKMKDFKFQKKPANTGSSPLDRNGYKPAEGISPILNSISDIRSNLLHPRPSVHSTLLDQTFRLDEKLKYKELLEKAAPTTSFYGSNDSFSKYRTPVGKIFTFGGLRGRQMVSACRKRGGRIVDSIDLTDSEKSGKLSTKATIIKVLDDFENEPIVVKDTDSDVEILPSPPTPPPDIKVDRVNSLKVVLDTDEETKSDWLEEFTKQHNTRIQERARAIRELQEHRKRLNEINREIRVKRLEDDVRRCLTIKEIVLPVEETKEREFVPLTDDQEDLVNDALDQYAPKNEVLAKNFGLNITRRDILTLAGLNWLNDEVINFYMNLIIERGKDASFPKAYAFNTFFYPKLIKDGHSSLRRWTRKVDIFAYDVIAIPIHLGMHWCMSVIDLRTKTIKYFDSMGGSNSKCLKALLNYLVEEHRDKKKSEFDTGGWKLENMKDIPQQMNGSDCGMFSCTFAEFLTRDAKITFSQEDMPYLRRKMVLEIVNSRLMVS